MTTRKCYAGALLLLLGASCALGAEPKVWNGEGVPPPNPVKSKVTLGAYIFPGWYRDTGRGDYPYRTHDEDSEWRAVAKCPKPRALLGFYDDSLPEVNDWHIKWALEHGITFFAFDWYWNAGEHRLMRTLEQGFLKARTCDRMKFCIHWCNHALDWRAEPWSKPGADYFKTPALVEMAAYLADNYFKRPNYLTVDGRPLFMVWDSRQLIAANGGPEGFRKALEEMNKVLRAKGLRDLYLVSMGDSPDFAAAGFNATTGYGCYGADFDSPYEFRRGYSIPYDAIIPHHETMWRGRTAKPELPYLLNMGSNWDDRPRAGKSAAVISGKTPEKFETICRKSLTYVDRRLNMAIIEAWNEWGEGSFIEPDKEWGFGFLDAVRSAFTGAPARHEDLVPGPERVAAFSVLKGEDLAKAQAIEGNPYPDPPVSRRSLRWEMDRPLPKGPVLKGWEFTGDAPEGWLPYQVTPLVLKEGILSTTVTGDDPQLRVEDAGVAIEEMECLALRLRASKGVSRCEVFWTTAAEPGMTAGKAFSFPINPDGGWHEYQLFRKPEGSWSGALKILRLDVGGAGDKLEIDWIRLYGKTP